MNTLTLRYHPRFSRRVCNPLPLLQMSHIEEIKSLSPATLKTIVAGIASATHNTKRFEKTPLWSVVGYVLSFGSSSSVEVCVKAGFKPHQLLTKKYSTLELIEL